MSRLMKIAPRTRRWESAESAHIRCIVAPKHSLYAGAQRLFQAVAKVFDDSANGCRPNHLQKNNIVPNPDRVTDFLEATA
jgi:hypothetical protein